jgi:hypothetical protein
MHPNIFRGLLSYIEMGGIQQGKSNPWHLQWRYPSEDSTSKASGSAKQRSFIHHVHLDKAHL